MPRPLIYVGAILVALSLLPMGWLAVSRVTGSPTPRVQVVPDMDNQPKARAQAATAFFDDGRAARLPVEGTLAREDWIADATVATGKQGEEFVTSIPVPVDLSLVERGRDRFEIYCAPCHGLAGRGDGLVARRASEILEAKWTPPTDLTNDTVAGREAGHIFQTITQGIRNMPSYAAQISVRDRWAIVAYVRALQRSVRGSLDDVPPDARAGLN